MQFERLGPYKIVDRIGAGGMGEVFKGVHEETGQIVAVKLLQIGEEDDPQLMKRFRREIVSAGRLSHDNIVRVYDSGEQEDHIWYAMEFVDGASLSEMLSGPEPLPVAKVLAIGRDVCKAFTYMHSRGFVHRDIKPGNIMVTKEGVAKLVDFGLVKSRFATNITVTGVIIGTPAFMSPEMLTGRDTDFRSDIFQLGQVLYKALSGRHAFDGSDSFDMASNCVSKPPHPLVTLNPKVSPALEAVLFCCLEKQPDDRYQSAADLANDLRRVEKGLKPNGTGRKPIPSSPTQPSSVSATVPTQAMRVQVERPPWAAIAGGAAAVLLLLVGIAALLSWRGPAGQGFRNLKIIPGLRMARVTWESESTYATRAVFRPARTEDESAGTEVVNGEETEASRHSLDLRGLEPDTEYQFSILYPDRTSSLPQQFKTESPGLVSTAFTAAPEGGLRFVFSTLAKAKVSVRYGQGVSVEASPATFATSHHAVLAGADVFSEDTVLVQCTNALQESWTANPVPMPSARTLARDLGRALDSAQPRIMGALAAIEKAERKHKLKPELVKNVLPSAVTDLMARFSPMGPVFFSSGRVTLDEKIGLYRPLLVLDALDLRAARAELPFDSGARSLLSPEFGPSKEPRLADSEKYLFNDETLLVGASLSAAQADAAATFGKTAPRVSVRFNLSGVAVVKRAELTARVMWEDEFLFDDELAVQVNGSLELVMREPPKSKFGPRIITFVHGFDPRALAEGANEFVLTLRPLPGFRSITKLLVKEVVLRLER